MKKSWLVTKIILIVIAVLIVGWVLIGIVITAVRAPASRNFSASLPSGVKESTYYTSEMYRMGAPNAAVESSPASSRIQVRVNGSAQPVVMSENATYEVSWNVDPQLFGAAACTISGMMPNHVVAQIPLPSPSGTWEVAPAFNPDAPSSSYSNAMHVYDVRCLQGTNPNQTLDEDMAEAVQVSGQ